MRKIYIIAKREYFKLIRKPSFWFSILFIPIFIIVLVLISIISSNQFERNINGDDLKTILILDQSNYIHLDRIVKPFIRINDIEQAKLKIKNKEADALILVPSSFDKSKKIVILEQDKGFFLQNRFNSLVTHLIKDSILSELNDNQKKEIFDSNYQFDITTYKDGEIIKRSMQDLIIPALSLILYFILTTFATNYLLLSVSEEKENRVMEIVLSTVKPQELITGKIFGLILVIFTQLICTIVFSVLGIIILALVFSTKIDFNSIMSLAHLNNDPLNSSFVINIGQLLLGIFYTFMGFFILAATMVGVGSAMPTYREAQALSSVFIMISTLPFYFITIILAEPSGVIAQIFSYIPFTANFILLFRSALGALSTIEIITSIIVLLFYGYIFLNIAFKLFEIGSLEYTRKISLISIFKKAN